MTADELLVRMSARELTERLALGHLRAQEQKAAAARADAARRAKGY